MRCQTTAAPAAKGSQGHLPCNPCLPDTRSSSCLPLPPPSHKTSAAAKVPGAGRPGLQRVVCVPLPAVQGASGWGWKEVAWVGRRAVSQHVWVGRRKMVGTWRWYGGQRVMSGSRAWLLGPGLAKPPPTMGHVNAASPTPARRGCCPGIPPAPLNVQSSREELITDVDELKKKITGTNN